MRGAYRMLVQHMQHTFGVKLWYVMLEQFLMKYVWSGAGMVVVSLPILLASAKSCHNDDNVEKETAPASGLTYVGDFSPATAMATPNVSTDSIGERTHYFTTAKNLLITGGKTLITINKLILGVIQKIL